jgi:hypothetical protein
MLLDHQALGTSLVLHTVVRTAASSRRTLRLRIRMVSESDRPVICAIQSGS